ncbi:MAG: tetratricopeptide repeat protein [Candidatus Sericytochromatia bacterium]|nr:tetratricopeptide repeat protein [Candidatus Sericytochromatia bacterium]
MKHALPTLLTAFLLLNAPLESAHAQTSQHTQNETMRLVVLPFRNITRQPEDEWLSESFSENLTVALSRVQQVQLIERHQIQLVLQEQSFTQSLFADTNSAPELGRLLGASKMLLGNYQKIGSTLVVSKRIVDVSSGQIDKNLVTQVRGDYQQVLQVQRQLSEDLLKRLGQGQPPLRQPTRSNPAYKQYCQALLLSRSGTDQELQSALHLLDQALAADPAFGQAHALKSELLSRRAQSPTLYPSARSEDLNQALAHASQALAHQSPPGPVYRALARAYSARGEKDKALATLAQALQELPADTDIVLAWIDLHPELPPEQLQTHLETAGVNLEEPWIQVALASRQVHQLRNTPDADLQAPRQALQMARQALPEHAMIPLKLAEIAFLAGDYPQAEVLAKEALTLSPNNFLLYFLAAQTLMYGPDQPQIISWLQRSIALNPRFGFAQMSLGYAYWRNNQLEEALSAFQAAEALFPESAALAFVRGKASFARGRYPEARQHLLNALQYWGQSPMEHVQRGIIFLKLGDIAAATGSWPAALSYYQQASAENDDSKARAFLKIARLQALQGDYPAAATAFDTYLQFSTYRTPEQIDQDTQTRYLLQQGHQQASAAALQNDLGRLALLAQDYALAEQHFQRALSTAADNPAIRYNLGLLRIHQQQWPSAIAELEQVLQLEPDHEKAHYNLGLAQLRSGQIQAARSTWEKLLQQDPGHLRAR